MTDVMIEIVFEFVRFGILVIDFGAVDGGFVGAAFVRHDDVFFVGEVGDEISRESEHGTKRGVAVQESFAVEADELRVDCAFCENSGVAAGFDTGEVGLFWIEREASVRLRVGFG